jgi:hypothetical protein
MKGSVSTDRRRKRKLKGSVRTKRQTVGEEQKTGWRVADGVVINNPRRFSYCASCAGLRRGDYFGYAGAKAFRFSRPLQKVLEMQGSTLVKVKAMRVGRHGVTPKAAISAQKAAIRGG